MASRRPRPRRFLLPTVLAAVLVGEITGIALARTLGPGEPGADPPTSAFAPGAAAVAGPRYVRHPDAIAGSAGSAPSDALDEIAAPTSTVISSSAGPRTLPHPAAVAVRRSVVAAGSSHVRAASGVSHPAAVRYAGRNHVWVPSLGINQSVQSFPCSRSRPPDAGVYRWGCAGHDNVYLLAHAWSTFRPLHDAYVSGRLHTGLKVAYADGGGRVHTFSVIWWKVVAPTTAASWAWAPLSRPGMTLQTCVGANSAYRLMVRLTQVG